MEQDKSHCKECNQIKTRIKTGEKYPNGSTEKFRDENGKLWSGRRCPDCQRNRAKSNMAKLNAAKKEIQNTLKPLTEKN